MALLAIVLILAAGCRATRTVSSTNTYRKDSIVIAETVRDTTVRIGADSSLIRVALVADAQGQIHVQQITEYRAGERMKPPQITIKDNILTARAEVDSATLVLQIKSILEKHYSSEKIEEHKTEMVETNRLTWWQTLWVKAGKIAVSILVPVIIGLIFKSNILTLWQKIKQKL